MKNPLRITAAVCLGLLQACDVPLAVAEPSRAGAPRERRIWMSFGERRLPITLTDNAAARAFVAQLPLTLDMPDLNGNEKHATLPRALPQAAGKPGTIHTGDLMLWGADTLVVFYRTFNSPYAYTRLGAVADPGALDHLIGSGTVQLTFSKD